MIGRDAGVKWQVQYVAIEKIMNERDETDRLVPGVTNEAPAPALNKGTLIGCAGILLVLSLPALLFLPLERLQIPLWLGNLIPLAAISAVVLGAYLLLQVPPNTPVHSRDPRHPRTLSGRSPILEQPARQSNRMILLLEGGLVLSAIIGYGMVSFASQGSVEIIGSLVIPAAGYVLLVIGFLASRRRVAVPAWRWVHVPVQGKVITQALPMMGLGLVLFIWSLILGAAVYWLVLPIGMVLLGGTILTVLMARLWQRSPDRTSIP